MRWILRFAAIVAAVIVLIGAVVIWSVTTTSGSQRLWGVAQSLAGKDISLGSIEGTIASTFEISDLQIATNSMQLSIEKTKIQWQPSALLERKLLVNRAQLSGVRYVGSPTSEEPGEPFSLSNISLPLEVDIVDAGIQSLIVLAAEDANPIALDSIILSAAIDQEQILLRPSSVQSGLADLTAEMTLGLSNNHPASGAFTWNLRPGTIAPVTGQAMLSGSLQNLRIDTELAPPYSLTSKMIIEDLLEAAQTRFEINSESIALADIDPDLPAIAMTASITGTHRLADNTAKLQSSLQLEDVPELGTVFLELDGGLASDIFNIASLKLSKPDSKVALEGSGAIPLSTDGDISLTLDWRQMQWPLQNTAALLSPHGSLRVTGARNTPTIHIKGEVSQPVVSNNIDLSLKLDLTGTQPRLAMKSNITDFSLPAGREDLLPVSNATLTLAGTYPLFEAASRLTIGSDANQPTLDSVVQVDLTNSANPDLNLKGTWKDFAWPLVAPEKLVTVDKGTFQASGTPQQLTAQIETTVNSGGKVQATLEYDASASASTLQASWSDLAFANMAVATTSPVGNLTVDGSAKNYHFDIDTELQADGKQLKLQSHGAGSLSGLQISEIRINALDGTVIGDAEIAWQPEVSATANLRLKNLNPGVWFSEWPGKIDAEVNGALQLHNEQLQVTGFRAKSNGSLRDYPISLDVSGKKLGNRFSVEQLIARSGETVLEATGAIDDKLDMRWSVSSGDLRSLHPDAKGQLSANGELKGATAEPLVTATVTGEDLSYQGNLVRNLDLTALVDISDQQQSVVDASLTGQFGSLALKSGSLSINGFSSDHKITLDTSTSSGRLRTDIDGALGDQFNWRFRLNDLAADTTEFGSWRLLNPGSGVVSAEQIQLDQSCLTDSITKVCIAVDRVGTEADLTTSIKNLPLQTLARGAPNNISVTGSLDAEGKFQWDGQSDPVGTLSVTSSSGLLAIDQDTGSDDGQKLLVFEPGNLEVSLYKGIAEAKLDLPLAGADSIAGEATLRGTTSDWSRRKLVASVNLDVNDISGFEDMIPEVDKLAGKINGVMQVEGSISKPAFNGDMRLRGGAVGLGLPEIIIEDIEVQLTGDPLKGMMLNANAVSGGGSIDLSGNIDVAKERPEVSLTLKGEDVQVMNTPQASIFVTPDFTFSMVGNAISLTGDLLIPKADISIKEIPASAITVSSDQVLVESEAEAEAAAGDSPLEISANVKTTLGENVKFSGFGLTGRFAGELVSIEQPGKNGQIRGEIRIVDGQYKAYGQNLNIETGRLLFADSVLVTPTIDLRATRQPTTDIRVGVVARGPIQQPEFSLVSSPVMTERNQLSYLLFGRPADQGTSGEKSQLGQLALAFGLGQTEGFTGKIKDSLGIDNIGVEAEPGTDAEQESFVLGKYLTPKLYLRYGVGLFEPVNTLRLQYAINERWRIVTESSDNASSGDIYYSIER